MGGKKKKGKRYKTQLCGELQVFPQLAQKTADLFWDVQHTGLGVTLRKQRGALSVSLVATQTLLLLLLSVHLPYPSHTHFLLTGPE